jgi:preprotein translocase subunit SecG
MIGLVLLQKSEGGGLGMGGGGGGFLTSRGTSNVLTRTTAILAASFLRDEPAALDLAGWDRKPRSILQDSSSPSRRPRSRSIQAERRRSPRAGCSTAQTGGAPRNRRCRNRSKFPQKRPANPASSLLECYGLVESKLES